MILKRVNDIDVSLVVPAFKKHFSGFCAFCFHSGDGARRDEHGHYQITGRLDDVINVSGHRLGTAEIEDIIDEHDDVAEAAVVSRKLYAQQPRHVTKKRTSDQQNKKRAKQ